MKCKIIQYLVGKNEKYLELAKECEKINRTYAGLYGYDFVFEYMDEDKVKEQYGKCTTKEIIAYKIKFMYDHLMKNDCDVLMFIDADAAVSKPQIKIEDLIDDQHEIFLSRGNERVAQILHLTNIRNGMIRIFSNPNQLLNEYWQDIIQREHLYEDLEWMSIGFILSNAGLYIIKNTDRMKNLFKDTLKAQELLMNTVFTSKSEDERAIGLVLLKQDYYNTWTFLYEQSQGGLACMFKNKYDVQNTFILHEFGLATTKDQKIAEVKDLWNNKWWKKIEK